MSSDSVSIKRSQSQSNPGYLLYNRHSICSLRYCDQVLRLVSTTVRSRAMSIQKGRLPVQAMSKPNSSSDNHNDDSNKLTTTNLSILERSQVRVSRFGVNKLLYDFTIF